MSILVVRHVPFEGLGLIGDVLAETGLETRLLNIGEDADVGCAQALILMGGPMSANDPEPWVEAEKAMIRRAIAGGVPVLGVCLGAQLAASALGARVYRAPRKEIGWFPVSWTADAANDPLLERLPDPSNLFHWHGETFDVPDGAVLLASSERCPHQAFRYGDRVYGLQFHAEVTPEMIADWCRKDENCGDVREMESPIDPALHAEEQIQIGRNVFRRWVERVVRP
jgi:GMP synthase-like glutamine amidotransferase